MLFNSFQFFLFLLIVLPVYLLARSVRLQNAWLLLTSYIFYAAWDWRFLSLILISTCSDFAFSQAIDFSKKESSRRLLLVISIVINLGILGFFKYFNFFSHSFAELLGLFGFKADPVTLRIILPLGISFYTFQTMGYVIDVFRKEIRPERNLLDFALYVTFFPQLVAGPIERARDLLPQIRQPRLVSTERIKEGCYLIYLGLFMKIFVADNLAPIVNEVFAVRTGQNGTLVLAAVYAFAFQIFCDFAGYSNMARGIAKLFGFELMVNFNLPYFATNPREFWRRWHISLSTWLRDYLYIPLGGSRQGRLANLRSLIIVMVLGGLWHGAAWTFVVWGFYHGLLLVFHRLLPDRGKIRAAPGLWRLGEGFFFFHLVCFGWLIFRAVSLEQVGSFAQSVLFRFTWDARTLEVFIKFCLVVLPLFVLMFFEARSGDPLILYRQHWAMQTAVYAFMAYLILGWGVLEPQEFIYFQF